MSFLTADNVLLDRLRGIVEPVEIRDTTGNVLGHYTPVVSIEMAALREKTKKLFDFNEAIRVNEAERNKGHTLEEIMQHLHLRKAKPEVWRLRGKLY